MFYNYEIANELLYSSRNKDAIVAADNILKQNEFLLPPFGRVRIDVTNNFDSNQNSRSYWRLVHGLTFLGDLYVAFNRTNEIKYLKKGQDLIELWFKYRDNNHDDKMIYHDETTALRFSYLLKFYYISYDKIDSVFQNNLKDEIDATVELLLEDSFHSTNTNHGMFQDIALLSYVILTNEYPKSNKIYEISVQRLINYFLTCFTKDGVHKEHSPDYHYMVTNYVKKVSDTIIKLDSNLNEQEQKLINIFRNAESYAMHVLLPNLKLPRISDCSGIALKENRTYFNMFDSPEFEYVKTHGASGVEPKEKQKAFMEAGSFFSRTNWKENGLYFLFLANYNAGYHKHTDDLSFVLYDNQEIFIDSGANGYDYKEKLTKYAYSGFAHSSLIVNNGSLPRNDGKFEQVGLEYAKYEENGTRFEVKGFNKRYEDVVHNRIIEGNNNDKEYIIKDEMISKNRNQYKILFQISHKLNVIINGNIVSIYEEKNKIAELEVDNNFKNADLKISILKGQITPSVQGYEFLKMGESVPANTIEILFYNHTDQSTLKTIVRLKNFKINPDIIENEKSFGKNNIKYTLYEPKEKIDRLLIVFSAMMPSYSYKYNYYNTLKDINAFQLYIKDDTGEFGNYYFGENKNSSFETEVISLIQNIIRKYEISNKNVTLIGSSKGGSAALYFGLKYGFFNVISGAPQTKIGNFVLGEAPHENVGEVVSGGVDIGDKLYLNNKFSELDLLQSNYNNFYICVGIKDHHLKGHINPLVNELKIKGVNLNIVEIPDANHNDLKYYFKSFLYESLNYIYNLEIPFTKDYLTSLYNLEVKDINIHRHDGKVSLNLDIKGIEYVVIYYMLDKNKNITSRSRPQKSNIITLNEEVFLNKRIKIFVRGKYETKSFISTLIRDLDNFTINKIK